MADDRTYSYDVFERLTERWPEAGDRLLSPGRDAFLAEDGAERNYRLLQGYKRAGDILIQHALAERVDRDSLVFPALFNYRHYIELALKAIIEEHGAFAGVSFGKKRDHKLPDLWKLFVKIAAAFGDDCSDQAVTTVAACIVEFTSIDASSTAFRYARNPQGDTLALPRGGLDLVRLHDVMNGIENFFECVALEFSHREELAGDLAV
jgi:hypothetical protein